MATIAEQLLAGAQASAQQSGEQLSAGIKTGAALAEQVERTQQMRQQMEQQKQQLQLQKVDKLTGLMEKGAAIKSKSARSAFFKNYIPKTAQALGLQDFIPEDTMMMIQADPEQAKKLSLLRAKITSGQMTYDQAVSQLDPEAFAMMDESEVAQLEAAEKFRVQQENTTERAKYVAGATAARAGEARAEAGRTEAAKDTGKEFKVWEAGGGLASYESAREVYKEAIRKLKAGEVKLGTWEKKIPYGGDESVLARTDPKAKALLDDIRGGINIRAKTGDPNPTAQQINAILSRSIDPNLSNDLNIEKLQKELDRMDKEAKTKVEAFRKGGFLPAEKTYDIGGRQATPEQAKAFYKANPQFLTPELKKELGL